MRRFRSEPRSHTLFSSLPLPERASVRDLDSRSDAASARGGKKSGGASERERERERESTVWCIDAFVKSNNNRRPTRINKRNCKLHLYSLRATNVILFKSIFRYF